ncbi:MAG: hypothetical protein ABEI78_00065 [Candidatus Nanohaloarchaea archaeon]
MASIILEILLLPTWAYALYLSLEYSNFKNNVRKYTSAMPYFVAVNSLFLILTLLNLFQSFLNPGLTTPKMYIFSLLSVQILAGLLLFKGILEIYKHNYASEGFQEVEFEDE